MSNTPPKTSLTGQDRPAEVSNSAGAGQPPIETQWIETLWSRAKEHRIAQWTLGYAAFAFAALHATTLLSDALEWPHSLVRGLTIVLLVGLLITPILAWYHGVQALKRVSMAEAILIGLLLAIAGTLLWRTPQHGHKRENETAETVAGKVVATPAVAPAKAAFSPPARSIAVLPFVNMSGDAAQDYFSDGISEELLNALSRLNELQVAARTSSFAFKGQNVDIETIAQKLNVGAVLEGSVRRAGNMVRITAQLINAQNGFHLWSQTYDRGETDILKVQAEVATRVAEELEVTMVGKDVRRLDAGGTQNSAAYEAYLRGSAILATWEKETDLRAALSDFDQAISLDPGYASAHAKRAMALSDIGIFSHDSAHVAQARQQALLAARRAVALAPEVGEAHLALADVLSNGLLDFAAAAPEFDRAVALAPGSARVQSNYAGYMGQLGHFEPALSAARRAVSLDPQNADMYLTLGQISTWSRQYDQAIAALRAAVALRPSSGFIQFNMADAMLASDRFEAARQLCESSALSDFAGGRALCLAFAYHGLNRQDDAKRQLELFEAQAGDEGYFEAAGVYAQWGDIPAALGALSKAEQARDPAFQLLRVSWPLAPLRALPEFKAIERRMKFPP